MNFAFRTRAVRCVLALAALGAATSIFAQEANIKPD